MDNIRSSFRSYIDIINKFTEKRIEERYSYLLSEIGLFLSEVYGVNYNEKFKINTYSLMHALLDYFSDIDRLKSFHKINRVNEYKILAYEIYWILKRHPIQILEDENEDYVFVNEKFALTYAIAFISQKQQTEFEKQNEKYKKDIVCSFINSFYYYLKFRVHTPHDLEMIFLAFQAGALLSQGQANSDASSCETYHSPDSTNSENLDEE